MRGLRRRRFTGIRAGWTGPIAALLVVLMPSITFRQGHATTDRAVTERADPGPERVVLLHGLGRGASDLFLLERRLEARGFVVCNVDYHSRVATIEIAAAEVVEGIRACGFDRAPIHFVTHSLGALVLRALAGQGAVPAGGRAVLLAPPNSGSEVADRLRALALLDPLLGPLARQLGTRPSDLPLRLPPPAIPFGVIAGDHWINPLGAYWLPAPHDGTVSVARTRLAGMSDHIVLPYTHTFIAWAEPVAGQVDAFLRRGRFSRERGADPP